MVIFLFLNSLVLGAAYLFVYKGLRIKQAVDSLIALFVVYFSQVIFIELVLGLAGALYLNNVIALSFVLFLSAFLLTKNMRLYLPVFNFKFYFKELLSNKVYVFIFSVAASFILVKILINLLNPPFGWDSLNYHFTFAVEWLKQGNLHTPITVFDDPSPTYYPINGSLFYLWLIFPFRSVFFADLGQFPFFIIAVVSVYAISQKLGLSKVLSFYCAFLFMLIPNFFKQLQIAYVDVMVGALFLVCVNWLFLLKDNFNFKNVLIYSLSCGLLIGIKTIALPFSILLIIPFLIIFINNLRKINLVLIFALCIIIFGGFSYFRNFFATGNPLYPFNYDLFNIHIFKGVMDKAVYSSHFVAYDYSLGKMLFHEGLGAQALLLILPGIFLALPLALVKRRKTVDFYRGYFFLLPILIYLVFRFIIPLGNLRYLYALMGLGVILGFYVYDLLKVNRRVLSFFAVLCVFASISELAKRQELVSSIIISALLFIILINFRRIRSLRRGKIPLVLFLFFLAGFLLWAENFYKKNEFSRYYKMVKYSGFWPDAAKSWDWLNNNTIGNNIAYTGRAVPFPLYGSGLKNNLYYASVNKVQPAKLHYFSNSKYEYGIGFESLLKAIEQPYNYRGNPDYDAWIRNLLKLNTDFLFVYSLQQTKTLIFPLEDNWAKLHPDKFEPVFVNNTIHIYKIIK